MPWLAALALAALAGWYFLGGGARPTFPTPPSITVGNQNIGAQLGSVVESLRGTLSSVRDEATARTALPRLQDMQKQIDGINTLRNQLSADNKKGFAAYVAQILPLIRPYVENALKGTGVGPVVKPVLDQIMARLDTMSKT